MYRKGGEKKIITKVTAEKKKETVKVANKIIYNDDNKDILEWAEVVSVLVVGYNCGNIHRKPDYKSVGNKQGQQQRFGSKRGRQYLANWYSALSTDNTI